MDYYDYDSFCRPTRDLKHSPLVDWPQHSFYQHNSLLSPDHRKQDDFLTYPLHQQPRSYDDLNLPHQQILHSPYSAILQSLQHNSLLSPDNGAPRIKQEELGGFMGYPHQQPRSYDCLNLPHQQVLQSPYSAVLQSGGDSNFVSVPPQDSMELPLQQPLDGWDDVRPSPLSSLVSSSPIPVPNLTEKSRGRRVPTMSSMEDLRSSASDDSMEVPLSHQYEGWDDDRPSSQVSSSPIPIPVLNLTNKKSRGRRVPSNMSSLDDLRSSASDDSMEAPLSHALEGCDDDRPSSLSSVVSSSPIPIPVPNLTKKSRGRRVPTMSSLEDLRSASSGAGKKRQGIGGKNARMYLCEVKGCGKCFARGEHLKRHVRSIHTYEKREV